MTGIAAATAPEIGATTDIVPAASVEYRIASPASPATPPIAPSPRSRAVTSSAGTTSNPTTSRGRPSSCDHGITFHTGNRRVTNPPVKSATPNNTAETSASS